MVLGYEKGEKMKLEKIRNKAKELYPDIDKFTEYVLANDSIDYELDNIVISFTLIGDIVKVTEYIEDDVYKFNFEL